MLFPFAKNVFATNKHETTTASYNHCSGEFQVVTKAKSFGNVQCKSQKYVRSLYVRAT